MTERPDKKPVSEPPVAEMTDFAFHDKGDDPPQDDYRCERYSVASE